MKRPIIIILRLGLALGIPAATAAGVVGAASARVYTPAELRADLARDPHAWVGRTVLVRGTVEGYLGAHMMPAFVTGGATSLPAALGLDWGPEDSTMRLLRGLPLVGRFAPAPQKVRYGAEAVYRVRLRALSGSFICPSGRCYAATLLDADPSGITGRPVALVPGGITPIPLWRGPERIVPIPLSRGPMRVMPLPYKPAVIGDRMEPGAAAR